MKKTIRILSIVMALSMILSVSAFAAESRTLDTAEGEKNVATFIYNLETGREVSPAVYNTYYASREQSSSRGEVGGIIYDPNGLYVYCELSTWYLGGYHAGAATWSDNRTYDFVTTSVFIYQYDYESSGLLEYTAQTSYNQSGSDAMEVYYGAEPDHAKSGHAIGLDGRTFTLDGTFLRTSW